VSAVDLFAGPGGWDQGLREIGVTDVLGFETDPAACATAKAAGHARLAPEHGDVSAHQPRDFICRPNVVASPVCRGFSMAGKGQGRVDTELLIRAVGDIAAGRDPRADLHERMADDRSVLALEPLRWVLALNSDWAMWEQVPTVLPLWEACAAVLREAGYSVWTGVVYAERFGVPQTRRRAVLLASRHGHVAEPVATHSRYHTRDPRRLDAGVQPWVSIRDALEADQIWGHETVAARARLVYRGSNQAHAAKRPLTAPAPNVNFSERSNKVEWMHPEIAADPKADGIRVTLAEAACLQSFPIGYSFRGTVSQRYRQIGDAVPPLLASHLGVALGLGQLPGEVAA
jgi:DNA (cytosine-5)-methyltransferase 1